VLLCGDNTLGQLGAPGEAQRTEFVPCAALGGVEVVALFSGADFCVALDAAGVARGSDPAIQGARARART